MVAGLFVYVSKRARTNQHPLPPLHTRISINNQQTEFIGYLLPYFLTAILPTMIGLGWRKINPDLVSEGVRE